MNTTPSAYTPEVVLAGEKIISADSHIVEPEDLWINALPASMKDRYPKFPKRNSPAKNPAAGTQSAHRRDGNRRRIGGSALPTLGLRLFAMEDAECQEACFEIANDWMIDYCKVTPGRLIGIPMISLYNIKNAIKELERCKKAGMIGCLIWQVPPSICSSKPTTTTRSGKLPPN